MSQEVEQKVELTCKDGQVDDEVGDSMSTRAMRLNMKSDGTNQERPKLTCQEGGEWRGG